MSQYRIDSQLEALGLRYPFTKDELTHAYRVKVFETHPDRGGKAHDFIKVQESYELLLPMCASDSNEQSTTRTIEGDLITELGKGLGVTVNSIDCERCESKGWYEVIHTAYNYSKCCPVCGGKGKIKTVHNYDRLSPLSWKNWRPCKRCLGLGFILCQEITHRINHTCEYCRGSGQKEIYNPVLQKGGVGGKNTHKIKIRKKRAYCSCGALLRAGMCWRCNKEEPNAPPDAMPKP